MESFDNAHRSSCCTRKKTEDVKEKASSFSTSSLRFLLLPRLSFQPLPELTLLSAHFVASVSWILRLLFFIFWGRHDFSCRLLLQVCKIIGLDLTQRHERLQVWTGQMYRIRINVEVKQRQTTVRLEAKFCPLLLICVNYCPRNEFGFISSVVEDISLKLSISSISVLRWWKPASYLFSHMLLATYRHPESTAPAAAYLCEQWTEDPLVPVSEPDLRQNIDLEFLFSHSQRCMFFCSGSLRLDTYSGVTCDSELQQLSNTFSYPFGQATVCDYSCFSVYVTKADPSWTQLQGALSARFWTALQSFQLGELYWQCFCHAFMLFFLTLK